MQVPTAARARRAAIVVASCLAAALPAAASASGTVGKSGGAWTFTGDGGEDVVVLSLTGTAPTQKLRFVQSGDGQTLTALVGCTQDGPLAVECPADDDAALKGGAGADRLSTSGLPPEGIDVTFDGGTFGDTMTGGAEADRFGLEPGADVIEGGGRNCYNDLDPGPCPDDLDRLDYSTATGPVTVTLGAGADDGPAGEGDDARGIEVLEGSPFADLLDATAQPGGGGIDGRLGNDHLIGSPGSNDLDGGDGNDTVEGGFGPDNISGGDGDDVLRGGPGQDDLQDDVGSDRLEGGPDDDFLNSFRPAEEAVPDVLAGGDGIDRANVQRRRLDGTSAPVSVTLDDRADDGVAGEGDDVRSDVEDVTTGPGDDTIVGNAAVNVLSAGGGNDTITAGPGVDQLFGGEGKDALQATDATFDVVDCGDEPSPPGPDTAAADQGLDLLLGCEQTTLTPVPPGPPLPGAPAGGATTTTTTTTTTAPPDTRGPRVTIGGVGATITRAAFRRNGLRLRVTTDEPATVAGELLAAVRTGGPVAFIGAVGDLGIGARTLPRGGGTRTLTLRPSAKFAKRVRGRRLRLTARLTVVDAAGNRTVATKKVRVR